MFLDRIILEQLLRSLPDEARIFVKDREPKLAEEAGKFGDNFVQARKFEDKE